MLTVKIKHLSCVNWFHVGFELKFLCFVQIMKIAWDAVEETSSLKLGWRPSRCLWSSLARLSSAGPRTTCWGSGTGSTPLWSSTRQSTFTTCSLCLETWTRAATRLSTGFTRHPFGLTWQMSWRAAVAAGRPMLRRALWIVCLLRLVELQWRWSPTWARTSRAVT